MFKNINELLTFIFIAFAFILVIIYLIKMLFSINKESFSLTKMITTFYDNEDE